MPGAVAFIQWDNYRGPAGEPRLFAFETLTFNSQQARLHDIAPGERLWLVSRNSEDQQYYFVALLAVSGLKTNAPNSAEAAQFGQFAVIADKSQSHDLANRFPAEGILRALQFERKKPIKHGASIGQSLQAIRLLSRADERLLDFALNRVLNGENPLVDQPFGLWTKCDGVFANYFLTNWKARHEPLAFLLYDPPPALPAGSLIFIHSDKNLRLVVRFRRSLYVAGHKLTVEAEEREAVREWVWSTYRANTIEPPLKTDYDAFWTSQNGIRSLFLMDELVEVPVTCAFKEYGRALEWGYPMGVGYRYLSLSQTFLLLACAGLPSESAGGFVESFYKSSLG